MIGNLNLLHVALTRAGKSLSVLGQRKGIGGRSKVIKGGVEEIQRALLGNIPTGDMDNRNDTISSKPEILSMPKDETKRVSENIF